MARKINNSYLLGQSNAPTTGGDMLKIRIDGTPVWEEVDGVEAFLATRTRGIWGGGDDPSEDYTNLIQYITIASIGNATDFGDLSSARYRVSGFAAATRGCFAGGYDGSNQHTTIEYITIATPGNTTDFGDLTVARSGSASCASAVRGLVAGGSSNVIDYVTIASTGNAINFGDLTVNRQRVAGCADATRGVFGGGYSPNQDTIDYVTIASAGNAIDFGNLTSDIRQTGACADATRGVWLVVITALPQIILTM